MWTYYQSARYGSDLMFILKRSISEVESNASMRIHRGFMIHANTLKNSSYGKVVECFPIVLDPNFFENKIKTK